MSAAARAGGRGGGPLARLRTGLLGLAALLVLLPVLLGAMPAGAATSPSAAATSPPTAATSPPTAATEAPRPPIQTGPGVPDELRDRLSREGSALVIGLGAGELDVTPEERADIRLGLVRTVSRWSPGFVTGSDLDPPTVPVERWIVPLLLDAVPVGVLTTGLDPEDAAAPARILADEAFGAALKALPPEAVVIHDEPLDAWFTLADGEVSALDTVARENLAGAVPVDLYQPLVVARDALDTPAAPKAAAQSGVRPVIWVALAAVALLGWAAVVVWLRRPEGPPRARERAPRRKDRGTRSDR